MISISLLLWTFSLVLSHVTQHDFLAACQNGEIASSTKALPRRDLAYGVLLAAENHHSSLVLDLLRRGGLLRDGLRPSRFGSRLIRACLILAVENGDHDLFNRLCIYLGNEQSQEILKLACLYERHIMIDRILSYWSIESIDSKLALMTYHLKHHNYKDIRSLVLVDGKLDTDLIHTIFQQDQEHLGMALVNHRYINLYDALRRCARLDAVSTFDRLTSTWRKVDCQSDLYAICVEASSKRVMASLLRRFPPNQWRIPTVVAPIVRIADLAMLKVVLDRLTNGSLGQALDEVMSVLDIHPRLIFFNATDMDFSYYDRMISHQPQIQSILHEALLKNWKELHDYQFEHKEFSRLLQLFKVFITLRQVLPSDLVRLVTAKLLQ